MSLSFSTHVRFLGPSRDHRTNRWEIACPVCGKKIIPPTTRLAAQLVSCEKSRKCRDNGTTIGINYNSEKIRLL